MLHKHSLAQSAANILSWRLMPGYIMHGP